MTTRAGLRKVVKSVRTKKGVVRRSYWVRAGQQVKAGGLAAGAIGALVAGGWVGSGLGQRAGAAIASRRAEQIFHEGLAGGTTSSLNRGASRAYNHMAMGGLAGAIVGTGVGALAGGYVAGKLATAGARRGLFKHNTVWARRIGATAGLIGGAVIGFHATNYGDNNRAERFREAYNARVRQARGEY